MHTLPETNRNAPETLGVEDDVSFWGPAFCQVLWLLVLGSVFLANSPSGTTLSKHIILGMTPW